MRCSIAGPNFIMLALHDLLGKLLYETLHTSICPNWSSIFLHVSATMLTIYTKYDISESFNEKNKSQYCFEEIQKHIAIDSLIKSILSSNEIHDDHENMLSLAPSKELKPLCPYQDIQSEKINFLIFVFWTTLWKYNHIKMFIPKNCSMGTFA
jgi:hypothetical protein